MTGRSHSPDPAMRRVKRSLALTWAGLAVERLARCFWPLWTLIATVAALSMIGVQGVVRVEIVWAVMLITALLGLVLLVRGARHFRWPGRDEAMARMDARLPGRPLTALGDVQAVGAGDAVSESLWRAYQSRMAERAASAGPVGPDLRLAHRDPFGLRYVALLALVVSLLFGSVWRAGTIGGMVPGGGTAVAGGPAWEGWIEPPAYTGRPSLYLNDQPGTITAPVGSRVTIRLYGNNGQLGVFETVSGRPVDTVPESKDVRRFEIAKGGTLRIDGAGGAAWDVIASRDLPPRVALTDAPTETTFDGQMSRTFDASDDYGVTGGTATFRLDADRIERDHGLAIEPEPRDRIVLDLPMPITGDRAAFTETLVENLSRHAWAHLPVTLELSVQDAAGQTGTSESHEMTLPARRFFDPLAAAVIEQRRDLLWSRENAHRVTQVMRAISYEPDPGLFRSETSYLRFRAILRRLETLVRHDSLTREARDEVAVALWDLAVLLEDGDIGDALERMRAAQERLSEAMKNGASEEEIARLMQELRDATQDYLRQKSRQAQREGAQDQGEQENAQNEMRMTQQDLQAMMDRIQELMEQGRFAEAQQALQEFQQMMENMRVTEGQGQQGQSPGQQAMEGLAETLRDQQGLSDQAFRDLQEQFNPGARSGQSQGNEGRNGGAGRGESHEGQQGRGQQGDGEGAQPGQGGEQAGRGAGSLADRQQELRRRLENQRGNLPGAGSEAGRSARESLDRADRAMRGAEEALRDDDLSGAIDQQSRAMEALRDGMRNLGEAMAERQGQGGQGQAMGQFGDRQSDPLGRTPGQGGRVGTQENLLQGEDVYRRARELLDEIRRRSGDGERPDVELEYLKRLLERF